MGKEKKEEMRKKGMLQSANFIKERIQGLAFTTLTHTHSHTSPSLLSHLSKKYWGNFAFPLKVESLEVKCCQAEEALLVTGGEDRHGG